jgi:hypothetical protein
MIVMHIYLDFVDHLIVEVYDEYCVKDVHDGHSKVVVFSNRSMHFKNLDCALNNGFKHMPITYQSQLF